MERGHLIKKLILVAFVAALALAAPLTVAQAAPEYSGATATATANLRMRAEPTTAASQIALVPRGMTVQVVGRNGEANWLYVDYAGARGWVAAWYTSVNGNVGSMPVVNGQAGSTPAQQPEAAPPPPAPSSSPEAAQIIHLLNQTRCAQGLNPLVENGALTNAAAAHAADMAANNYFAHYSLDGRDPGDRLVAHGYGGFYGENLAAGRDNPTGTFQQWVDSAPHNANMLNGSFTEVGVGYVYQSGTTYRHYWVLEMGTRRGVTAPSCAALGY